MIIPMTWISMSYLIVIKVFGTMAYPASGSFAEYAKARTDSISRKPRNLTHAEAAVLPVVGKICVLIHNPVIE